LLKIGAIVVVLSAIFAGLSAFIGSKENLSELNVNRDSLEMSDRIVHIKEVRSVAKSNDQFSIKLCNLLKEKEGNLSMSPFSVSGVMAMVSAGAGGNTLDQIREGLSFPSSSSLQLGYQDAIPALRSTENFTLEAANTVLP
jgi:serine protease inhibitor